ncbi:zinc finger CCCH domain-containing protein 7B isoform X2 [Dendrobates tinctorius]|uniref:zinc finger CCCH domain-containing protein 7B isoform X2 n=1 Tax=Dendrobates tinctorius TaxID=92724 RepID=UPI003CC9F671
MSSKKAAKKKRNQAVQPGESSAEHVVFGLMSELLCRGIEKGTYRWCLRKNADPQRTVIVVFVPSDMPDCVICSVVARALNRGLVRIVDTTKSESHMYRSVLVEAEGIIGTNACPTLICCEDSPLGYWIMVAPVEDENLQATDLTKGAQAVDATATKDTLLLTDSLIAKDDAPAAKDGPPLKGALALRDASPAKDTSATKDTPTSKGNLAANDAPPAKDTPALKDAPPSKVAPAFEDVPPTEGGTPSTKDGAASKDTLAAKDAPPPKGAPAAKDAPPPKGAPAAKDAPPPKGAPAAKDAPPPKGAPAAKDAPPPKGAPAAKDAPPPKGAHAAKGAPPPKGAPAAKGAPSPKGAPAAKGAPPPKGAPAAKGAPPPKGAPAGKDAPPPKGAPAGKDAPPPKGAPAGKDAPPPKGAPAGKNAPPPKGAPAAKDAPPPNGAPAAKDAPPPNGALVAKDAPPPNGAPAAKDAPPPKGAPAAKDAPPPKGAPAAKDAPPPKGAPAAKDAPPPKGAPAAKDAPPPKGAPAAKDAPPPKGAPAAKDAPPVAQDAPPPKSAPAAQDASFVKSALATKDVQPTKDAPPAKSVHATKDAPPAKSVHATKDAPPAKSVHATKDAPPAKSTHAFKACSPANDSPTSKDAPLAAQDPPIKGTLATKDDPPSKDTSPAVGAPAIKNAPANKESDPTKNDFHSKVSTVAKDNFLDEAPQTAKCDPPVRVILSAEDSLLSKMLSPAKDFFPAKGLLAAKYPSPTMGLPAEPFPTQDLPVIINGDVKSRHGQSLQIQGESRASLGRILIKPNPILTVETRSRPGFPARNLPEPAIKVRSDVYRGFSMERQIRREDIEKGLQFIQSTIPFHGTQDDYKCFLQKLVEDLFTEGNDLYREGKMKLSLGQYTEGLTVAEYAAAEELALSQELLCRLFVNRSCCYFSMGLFEKSLEDSEEALSLDKENMRALYRKAKALDQLGKHQEAYACISHRILALVQDESITELAQELVKKLGLKQRRAYKRPQELEKFGLLANGVSASANCKISSVMGSVDDIYSDLPNSKVFSSSLGITYENDSLETAACAPSVAPVTNNVNDLDCDVIGDELDSFLDFEMASQKVPQLIPVFPTGNPLLSSLGTTGLPAPSPLPPASFGLLDPRKPPVLPLKPSFAPSLDALDSFETMRETLDSLDTFVNDTKRAESVLVKTTQKQKPIVNSVNHLFGHKTEPGLNKSAALPPLLPNPLAQTYDFKQGCQLCYARTGPKALDFAYKEKFEHKCKKDILLARMKSSENKAWLKIRQRPMKVNFSGPFMLCKDIQSRQDCKYGDNCTFAYYQEEIDVWNEERKGALHRDQLFQLPGLVKPGSVSRFLHEQKGIFTFLCQACFDSKPQIISKRNPENSDVCTNPSNQHSFSDHKCLVHVLNSSTVKYSKIRLNHSRFQMDVCRHEVRYGCHQEDACNFAHSHVELCVWMLQRQSGVTQEEIVLESERMWKVVEPKSKPAPKPLDMKMKFVCGQCLRNGREIEADRDGKYCTAKARHSWTNDKRVLLVMSKAKKKWVPIRALPSIRNFPQQYEICIHVQNGKKCQYTGPCTFAHYTEEKDVWTFMKENKVLDLQLIFDLCNKNNTPAEKPGKMAAAAAGPHKEGEKQIVMPTDYADLMAGFHCYLCGKNSNSERQWQKHIQSEKHKDRVFTLEGEESSWKYRFPAGEFKLCERYEETQSCPHENNCPFAHGSEELAEWHERRKVLQYKVSKARKDMLLEPSDSDFGKYSFIMQDLAEDPEE